MLILTRRLAESIVIGEDGEIEIIILAITKNKVRIGINAKKDIPVDRAEIYKKKTEELQLKNGEQNEK